jgi:hypothetical protein
MDRRSLLKMIAATTGAAMFGNNVFAYETLSKVALSDTQFKPEDASLFNEIAEVILPRTDTPGAKDANVGVMSLIIANDCYATETRDVFTKGLASINDDCMKRYAKPFVLLTKEQKSEYVESLDEAAKVHDQKNKIYWVPPRPHKLEDEVTHAQPHFFTLIKQLTVFSFFTSEIGATKVLRYSAIPGKYDGEMDYKKGDRAWAT